MLDFVQLTSSDKAIRLDNLLPTQKHPADIAQLKIFTKPDENGINSVAANPLVNLARPTRELIPFAVTDAVLDPKHLKKLTGAACFRFQRVNAGLKTSYYLFGNYDHTVSLGRLAPGSMRLELVPHLFMMPKIWAYDGELFDILARGESAAAGQDAVRFKLFNRRVPQKDIFKNEPRLQPTGPEYAAIAAIQSAVKKDILAIFDTVEGLTPLTYDADEAFADRTKAYAWFLPPNAGAKDRKSLLDGFFAFAVDNYATESFNYAMPYLSPISPCGGLTLPAVTFTPVDAPNESLRSSESSFLNASLCSWAVGMIALGRIKEIVSLRADRSTKPTTYNRAIYDGWSAHHKVEALRSFREVLEVGKRLQQAV